MRLANFSVDRPIAITMFILIVVLFGTVAFFQIGLEMMPDLEFPLAVVVTDYPGVAPEEVEQTVTLPIERSVSRVENVKRVYSISSEGRSTVVVEFSWDANLDFAVQDVRDRLGMVVDFLPDEADTPVVFKYNPGGGPVLVMGVTGMKDTMQLRKYLEDVVSPNLERLKGVAIAFVMGGLEREINVMVDQQRLKSYGLSISDVVSALQKDNVNVSGGHVSRDYTEYLIRTLGEYKSVELINKTVIAVRGGVPIRVSDVAVVQDTHKEVRNHTRLDGKECVILGVLKQSGENTYSVIKRVYQALDEMKGQMPPSIKMVPLLDQAVFIRQTVSRTVSNALLGAALAIAFLLAFLRKWRPTLTVAIAMPISVATAFIGMYALDYTFNLMTLAGFALGAGMLVDNAVVVIENIFRHIERGKDAKQAAKTGAAEVATAIFASTSTTIAVFLPMVLIWGVAGQFSRPMALTVCLALLSSLIVATTIVPMLASRIFVGAGAKTGYTAGSFERPKGVYERLLRKALCNRKKVLAGVGVGFLLALFGASRLGFEFIPKGDFPMLLMNVRMPVGTVLEQTSKVCKQIEEFQSNVPATDHVLSFVGPDVHSRGPGGADVNEAVIYTRLKDSGQRELTSDEFQDLIRQNLPKIKGASFNFMAFGPGTVTTSADQADIAVRVFGKDLRRLKKLGDYIFNVVRGVPGTRDVDISLKQGKPELQIALDRDKISQLGLSVSQVANYIKYAALGDVATHLRVGGDEYDIRVRLRQSDRDSLEKILRISIPTPLGGQVPLYQLAKSHLGAGPIKITRENQQRKVTVTADTFGRDLGSIVAEIKRYLAKLKLPRGYRIDYGGRYEDMAETFEALGYALIAAVLLVYMIMAALFESLRQPFVVMFTVPLGLIGVIGGLALAGKTVSTPAIMGLIILVGIVVNNAIVMIDYVNRLRRRGVERHEALVKGAVTRLRPILITSLTTIMAMLPMAFSTSEGAEMRSPMGIAIAAGLACSMALTLLVIPVVYSIVEGMRFGPAKS